MDVPPAPTRVLLVGGSAFLGAHVVCGLLKDPAVDVAVMDLRPYTGPHADRVQSLLGDVTSAADCDRVFGEARFDAVVSMVTPDLMTATEEAFERVNVGGVHTLLAACGRHGVTALVYVSSIAVMDHFTPHEEVDETSPLPPLAQYRSPYDRTKRLGEDAVLAADRPGALRTCALRMGGILSDLRDVGLRFATAPVAVMQSRGERIDMLDGRCAAHGVVLAVRALLTRPDEVGGEAFFLTKGSSVTAYHYFSFVAERLGHRVVVMPAAVSAVLRTVLGLVHGMKRRLGMRVPGVPLNTFMEIQDHTQTFDNGKARRLLGYEPPWTLEEGLAAIVDASRPPPPSSVVEAV